MSLSAYEDLVHELARLDADSAASTAQAQRKLERRKAALKEVRTALDAQTARVAELCSTLRQSTPDLMPTSAIEEAEAAVDEPETALAHANTALREAELSLRATVRAAQRPTLLPDVHHVVRELLVYGSCMIACLIGQLIYLAATGGGGEASWWVMFLPPVMAALVGYLLVGAANRPRLPLTDRSGKPVKAVVPHNPRLGVTLAVCTMALFAYFAFFA
ncbi:hypothetical protein SAMN05216298_4259 [Glycomyces sambucus]|uniref:Uncharacterized protein n=1 Tax=Glycomyces sambucus TaxID=380244 RepID=A0A1G9KU48_9ACTN|nr:hypothetical protein [Glycomyces sambucus]SDL53380.1 hypothetical protein SAMN05216298_4259 [Glycomyces sambucus]